MRRKDKIAGQDGVDDEHEDKTRQEERYSPRLLVADSGPTSTSTEKGNEPIAEAGSCDGAIGAFASSCQHNLPGRSLTVEIRRIRADKCLPRHAHALWLIATSDIAMSS
jgi:hypothetical protein